ncbi:hypothetical protein AVEN_192958-1 [Araneus ventricosus]|uniref:Uncharacterized protein n=1 Tax=Araneus ventricosus TaxID=182803 RepID=A0A4Y2TCU4_ARAVE|nr:hypothetical protein AVEN_192958-1 [Araneus ventricosus]
MNKENQQVPGPSSRKVKRPSTSGVAQVVKHLEPLRSLFAIPGTFVRYFLSEIAGSRRRNRDPSIKTDCIDRPSRLSAAVGRVLALRSALRKDGFARARLSVYGLGNASDILGHQSTQNYI